MARLILGVVAGFIAWLIAWVGSEKLLSAVWPEFGAHQRAFEDAVENGGQFTADAKLLCVHIVMGSIVSLLAGFLAALIAKGNSRAPLILGFVLLALGLLKMVMSWPHVPIWYHVTFTAVLMPMAILGGKLLPKKPQHSNSR